MKILILRNRLRVYSHREWFATKHTKIKTIIGLALMKLFLKMVKIIIIKDNPSEKIIVGPTESMSKSKKNTVDPEQMIKNYGADAVRLFILSDSPPEKDVQWSEEGIAASHIYTKILVST